MSVYNLYFFCFDSTYNQFVRMSMFSSLCRLYTIEFHGRLALGVSGVFTVPD